MKTRSEHSFEDCSSPLLSKDMRTFETEKCFLKWTSVTSQIEEWTRNTLTGLRVAAVNELYDADMETKAFSSSVKTTLHRILAILGSKDSHRLLSRLKFGDCERRKTLNETHQKQENTLVRKSRRRSRYKSHFRR